MKKITILILTVLVVTGLCFSQEYYDDDYYYDDYYDNPEFGDEYLTYDYGYDAALPYLDGYYDPVYYWVHPNANLYFVLIGRRIFLIPYYQLRSIWHRLSWHLVDMYRFIDLSCGYLNYYDNWVRFNYYHDYYYRNRYNRYNNRWVRQHYRSHFRNRRYNRKYYRNRQRVLNKRYLRHRNGGSRYNQKGKPFNQIRDRGTYGSLESNRRAYARYRGDDYRNGNQRASGRTYYNKRTTRSNNQGRKGTTRSRKVIRRSNTTQYSSKRYGVSTTKVYRQSSKIGPRLRTPSSRIRTSGRTSQTQRYRGTSRSYTNRSPVTRRKTTQYRSYRSTPSSSKSRYSSSRVRRSVPAKRSVSRSYSRSSRSTSRIRTSSRSSKSRSYRSSSPRKSSRSRSVSRRSVKRSSSRSSRSRSSGRRKG
jgi:hypothetical protein